MSFTHDTLSTQSQTDRGRQARPSFSSHATSDRLRESERAPSSFVPRSRINPQRRSVFKEEGLDDLHVQLHPPHIELEYARSPRIEERDREKPKITFDHILKDLEHKNEDEEGEMSKKAGGFFGFGKLRGGRPQIKTAASAPPGMFPTIPRVALIVLLICVVVPGFRYSGGAESIGAVDAGVIRTPEMVENGSMINGRQDSPTTVCTRWAHQAANVNGTLYIFGGQATTYSGQENNTWSRPPLKSNPRYCEMLSAAQTMIS